MGRVERSVAIFTTLALLLPLLTAFVSPLASAAEARGAVVCLQRDIADLPSALTIDDGECVDINLGMLQPETILDIDLQVAGDPIDLLIFDDNGLQTYLAGQNYHLSTTADPSLEGLSMDVNYHWRTPDGLSAKRWHIVLDNMAHSGDEGLGDQGGNQTIVTADATILPAGNYEQYHDLEVLAAGSHIELIGGSSLTMDAGTLVTITAWPLAGEPDLYLMTDSQRAIYLAGGESGTHIPGTEITAINTMRQLAWTVPESLDGMTLHLMLDNEAIPAGGGAGTVTAKVTVQVLLSPVLDPVVQDDILFAVAELGASVNLDAGATPNRMGQVDTLYWDLDSMVDSDANGNPADDQDAGGWTVTTTFATPGSRYVTLTIADADGNTASKIHNITVVDTTSPSIWFSHSGQTDEDDTILTEHGKLITFSVSSQDAHVVASTRWLVDGTLSSNSTNLDMQWGLPGSHTVAVVVTDASGNEASISRNVSVTDASRPVIDRDACNVPSKVTAGESTTLVGGAGDAWDEPSALRYTWDLDPSFDSDGDGDPLNDPDLEGQTTGHIFNHAGTTSLVLSVRDAAGNTDTESFTITVEPASDGGNLFAIVMVIILILIVTAVGGLVGWRKVQEKAAAQLLLTRGLNQAEIDKHLLNVKSSRKLSFIATAEQIAGLDLSEVKPQAIMVAEAQADLASQLYGESDPMAGFQRSGGRDSAEQDYAALAGFSQAATSGSGRMLSEDEFTAIAGLESDPALTTAAQKVGLAEMAGDQDSDIAFLQSLSSSSEDPDAGQASQASQASPEKPEVAKEAAPTSGGVEVPEGLVSTPVEEPPPVEDTQEAETGGDVARVKAACGSCGQTFALIFPEGTNEVLLDCPSCGVEQALRR